MPTTRGGSKSSAQTEKDQPVEEGKPAKSTQERRQVVVEEPSSTPGEKNSKSTDNNPANAGQSKGAVKKRILVSYCGWCDKEDTREMVQCDECDTWFHFECADVTGGVENRDWLCMKCDNAKHPVNPNSNTSVNQADNGQHVNRKGTPKVVEFNTSKPSIITGPAMTNLRAGTRGTTKNSELMSVAGANVSKGPSAVGSQVSRQSLRQNLELEIQKLEEAKLLKLQQIIRETQIERDFLDSKYELLMDSASQAEENSDDVIRFTSKIQHWADDVDHTRRQPAVKRNEKPVEVENCRCGDCNVHGPHCAPSDEGELSGFARTPKGRSTAVGVRSRCGTSGYPLTIDNLNDYDRVTQQRNSVENFEPNRVDEDQLPTRGHNNRPTIPDNTQPGQRNNPGTHRQVPSLNPPPRQDAPPRRTVQPADDGLGNETGGMLNRSQLAARQAVPKELPEFNGSPEDWPLFYSMFSSSTDMCGFSNEENMLRLRKCLKGRALEAVRCRLLHPSNVEGVMSTLKMLYGKPETIIHAITKKIRALPPPNIDRLETLVNFALSVENLCATIEACDVYDFMYNASLRYELIEKLPSTLKLDWAKYARGIAVPTLSDFSRWLYSMAEDASNVLITDISTKSRGKKEDKFLNIHSDSHQSSDHSRNRNQSKSEESKSCGVCKGSCTSVAKCKRFAEFSTDSKWATVRELRLCRKCLGGHYGSCRQQKVCGVNGCSFKHHPLLHTEKRQQGSSTDQQTPEASVQSCNVHQSHTSDTLFRIVPVVLHGINKRIQTFAFLDDGSELTLMEEDLLDQLEITGTKQPLCLKWTGDTRRMEANSRKVDLKISGVGSPNKKYSLSGVRTVQKLNLPKQTLLMEELCTKYPYLEGLPIESYKSAIPKILIGLDHTSLGHVLKGKEGAPNQPVAVKTRLGWIAYGSCNEVQPASKFVNFHVFHTSRCDCQNDEDLHQMMKDYFSLDSMGVVNATKPLMSAENTRAQEMLQSLTVRKGDRFETGLLWKYDNARLPESRTMALKRWECLERRMSKDQLLADAVRAKITEYEDKRYIRKLSQAELEEFHPRIWYLPIFPVFNPNKPEKIRLVWDAAASSHGISLNALLLKGPDQLSSLPAVLLMFRQFKVGVCGDLREMFLQLLMQYKDRNCLRFFFKITPTDSHPSVYITNVMPFGTTCSPSCAQYVKNLNALEFQNDFPAAAEAIVKCHYVDDMLVSVESEAEAIQLARDVKLVHQRGGFEMRNWKSNSIRVLESLNEPDTEAVVMSLDLSSELATEKVLGLWWCTESDCFTFKLSARHNPELLAGTRVPTKRELLRTLMMIFDPLGLIAHVLMYLKVLLQEVWRSGVQWDDPIPDKLHQKWLVWLKVLPLVEKVKIPRCFRSVTSANSSTTVQMHTFVDGGDNGFAAAVFLRFEEGGQIECSLVSAKTRVAPLKFLSTPRCELQGAVLGVRLSNSVMESLTITISKRYFWTDSRDLLCWLNSDHRRYSQYVGCRIGEILETTDVNDWRYVPSRKNVADDGTKWERMPDVSTSSRWFIGPDFLRKPEEEWPRAPFTIGATDLELRPHFLLHREASERVISAERYSTWKRLQRVAAFVLRFIRNLRNKVKGHSSTTGPLEQFELAEATDLLYREAQMDCYCDEIVLLRSQPGNINVHLPKSSPIFRVAPYIDAVGVLRSRTRIQACDHADPETKNPVILPPAHHITHLVMQHYHEQYNHINHTTVINELRLRYSISRFNSTFRKVRFRCQKCKVERAKPIPPVMAELPSARLAAFARPFSYIGIDYFGPIMVLVGRRAEKRWGVLITCLTVRAVHIEIAHTLNTGSCIMALRRFISRRGSPIEIYSDRGTNFQGASKELSTLLENINQNQLMAEFVDESTTWKFITPGSPHMGGAWERMVQTVKRNLQQMKLPRLPSDEVLCSALVEIENTINSRPLTHVPVDDELAFVLTPNHFLLGTANGMKPLVDFDDTSAALKRSWELSQSMANFFWKHWIRDYLPCLTRRSKWFTPAKPIAVDDVVVIVDPQLPRNVWPKGRVIATSQAKDGQDNLVERKHHRLSRSARSGLSDRDAKPTASVRDLLHSIVHRYSPTSTLSSEEQDLIWKYRFYLSTQKKALTKFLKCINWETGTEVRQALALLAKWAPMDVEDALELLNSSFNHPTVRRYAISRLDQAVDDDLLLYLLQLVQALKYEHFEDIINSCNNLAFEKDILKPVEDNNIDANFEVFNESDGNTTIYDEATHDIRGSTSTKNTEDVSNPNDSNIKPSDDTSVPCNLAMFLIQRACKNSTLANYLYWYLSIECEEETIRKQDERVRKMYRTVLQLYLRQLSTGSPELRIIHRSLKEQQKFIDGLVKLIKIVAKEPGNRKKKTEKFQMLLSDTDSLKINFTKFEPLSFPLDPFVRIRGIVAEKVTLFKSALMPSKLTFLTTGSTEYVAIFKHGDDLRQDQLILQMITLMDKLLQKENLDLKLTPYRVLATSSKHGFMQYIDSITVAEVLNAEGNILNFFRKHHPCETGPYGIVADVMDTYIKSCAGYCVITYLLGVGDRHLDNLLLTNCGKLFHIDFGYILGRDPKPMPPPMKLSKEMVEAMGGLNSEHYQEFRKLCYTAFLHLRRHANVMLNLFGLMVDASIPDIALEPDKAVKKVEDNLRLDLSDEEAVQHLQNLLDLSITAVMPALVEQIHKLAQYWRK